MPNARRWSNIAAGVACAELVLLYAPTLRWLWERWTLSVWYQAHGILVPPVVAYLVYVELRALRDLPAGSSPWGFAVVLFALLLQVLDAGMHTELLSAVSLVLILPGLSLLFLGTPRTTAILFPLAFAAFALPIPLSLTETIHLALRHAAATATASLVPLLGIPVYVEGTMLQMPRANLMVGDACSGFSTVYAAVAMAFLTAHHTAGWGRRAVVIASAVPLAIAANILRIIILVAVVASTGIDVLSTWIHPASGMLTFALALPLIYWVGQSRAPEPVEILPGAAATEG